VSELAGISLRGEVLSKQGLWQAELHDLFRAFVDDVEAEEEDVFKT
jgi:hypothetical protein